MKLYMIRHGESECNLQRRLYGRTDCALTDKGCRQARESGEKLRGVEIARCIASPLIRAAETARLAFPDRRVPIELDDRLVEQYMGDFEDKPFEDMLREQPELVNAMLADWTQVVPPGGESFEDQCRRVAAFLDEVRCLPARHIGVFTHRGTIACAQIYTGTVQPGNAFASDIPYGSTLTFDLSLIPPCRDGYCQNGK